MQSELKRNWFVSFLSFTAVYGKTFELTNLSSDVYKLKIYTGGFARKASAKNRLYQEAEKYIKAHDYKSFKLIDSKWEYFGSGYVFLVSFSKV